MNASFKDKLKAHRPDWDKSAFWAALEPELPKPKKDRFLWWMWMLPAAVLLYAGGIWHSLQERTLPNDTAHSRSVRIGHFPIPLDTSLPTRESYLPKEKSTAGFAPATIPASSPPSERVKDQLNVTPARTPSTQPALGLLPALPTLALPLPARGLADRLRPVEPNLPPRPSLVLAVHHDEDSLAYWPELTKPSPKPKHQWHQAIYFGMGRPIRKLTAPDAERLSALSQQKDATESVREALSLGYTVGIRHRSGFFAQAGLEIQQRRELLQWEGIIKRETSTATVESATFFYSPAGTPVYQAGAAEATLVTKRHVKQQNYYRAIQLPARLGYHRQSAPLGWLVRLGADLNLAHSFSGKFIDSEQQVVDQASVNQSSLNRQLGLGWAAGAGIAYRISPKRTVCLTLEHTGFPASIHRGQGYEQYYHYWGLRLSLQKINVPF